VIPGNDDSAKAVTLYARGMADAVLEGKANAVNDVVKAVPPPKARRVRRSAGRRRLSVPGRAPAADGKGAPQPFSILSAAFERGPEHTGEAHMAAITASMVAELRAKTDAP
jgi:hypothetical protein